MTSFHWHDHHFVNRNPALDFTNMVVWRNRPERREDRGRTPENLAGWASFSGLVPPMADVDHCTAVRETIDRYFRLREGWSELVSHYAAALAADRDPFLVAILHSAMALAFSADLERVKICGNCGWLFIDRTRNANKRWCTTDICGSRTRARRYYAKKTESTREDQTSSSSPPSNT